MFTRRTAIQLIAFLALHVAFVQSAGLTFEAIKPGGETTCAFGGEYAFFYRKGKVNKLAVFFEGGGACWNSSSCELPIYTSSVDVDSELAKLNGDGPGAGINSQDPRSVIADWHNLYIPYCSADCHTGNATRQYSSSLKIHHKGRVNTHAALEYIFKTVPDPEVVATIGCSAGSLGSYINAPYVMNHYKNAKNYQFGDSYIGVFAQEQYNDAYKNWNLEYAPFIKALGPEHASQWFPDIGAYIISASANYFPNSTYSGFTHDHDTVQTLYWELGGGHGNWSQQARNQINAAHGNASNIATFIGAGYTHCVSDHDKFFDVYDGKEYLYEWIASMFSGSTNYNKEEDCKPFCWL